METNSRKLIQRLQQEGWQLIRVHGDHHIFRHPRRPGRVIIPHPKKDLPKGTLMSIYKDAGWRK